MPLTWMLSGELLVITPRHSPGSNPVCSYSRLGGPNFGLLNFDTRSPLGFYAATLTWIYSGEFLESTVLAWIDPVCPSPCILSFVRRLALRFRFTIGSYLDSTRILSRQK
jgi:hypothetical protein